MIYLEGKGKWFNDAFLLSKLTVTIKKNYPKNQREMLTGIRKSESGRTLDRRKRKEVALRAKYQIAGSS